MRLKILLFSLLFILFAQVNTFAYELTNDDGALFESGSEIAAYKNYTITNDVDNFELIVSDSVSHQILKVYTSNSGSVNFMLPASYTDISIAVTDYNDSNVLDQATRDVQDFKVVDYGYEVIENLEYNTDIYDAKFTISDRQITFDKAQNEALEITYQFVKDVKAYDLKFGIDDTAVIDVAEGDIFQFTETVDGKQSFYEVEIIGDDYVVRSVSSFDLKEISSVAVLDWLDILALVIFVCLGFVFKTLAKKQKKKENKKRKKRRRNG